MNKTIALIGVLLSTMQAFVFHANAQTPTSLAQTSSSPATIPPEPPRITPVPELMAFSGKWAGEWYGERTNTLMGDGTIDFEMVVAPITVTYAGVGKWGDIKGYKWNHHVEAKYDSSAITFSLANGTIVVCKINRDGTLSVRREDSKGGAWTATMRKL